MVKFKHTHKVISMTAVDTTIVVFRPCGPHQYSAHIKSKIFLYINSSLA